MIAVPWLHAEQGYKGIADYETGRRRGPRAVNSPVVANGDNSISPAKAGAGCSRRTGAERSLSAAPRKGRPWIFADSAHHPSHRDRRDASPPHVADGQGLLLEHLDDHYNRSMAIRTAFAAQEHLACLERLPAARHSAANDRIEFVRGAQARASAPVSTCLADAYSAHALLPTSHRATSLPAH